MQAFVRQLDLGKKLYIPLDTPHELLENVRHVPARVGAYTLSVFVSHHLCLSSRSVLSNMRPAGRMQPAGTFYLARGSPLKKISIDLLYLLYFGATQDPYYTKTRHFELKNRKKILGRGHCSSSDPSPSGGQEHPLPTPHPTPLDAFGTSILAPSALDLVARQPKKVGHHWSRFLQA